MSAKPEAEPAAEETVGETSQPELAQTQSDINPYAYLQRNEFTSEIYKIELNNLPWKFGAQQLKKKLLSSGLKPGKIKAIQPGSYAFINFRCEDDRKEALQKLDGLLWKGKKLRAKKANPAADPLLVKRKRDTDVKGEQSCKKRAKLDTSVELSFAERLNEAVSPLWKLSYEEQVQEKESEIRTFLKKLGREIMKNSQDPNVTDHLRMMFEKNQGLCCKLFPVKRSPILKDYRNKCEVTIGQSPDGTDKVVGFRLGRYKGGSVNVVSPEQCVIMPKNMKISCRVLQKFLQSVSICPGFDPETKRGNWMMAVLRGNRHEEIMMAVVFHPQELSADAIMEEKNKLRGYFMTGPGHAAPITSLYFSVQSDRHDQDTVAVYEHLGGDMSITEDLLDMKFRISPRAFFQVNTLAAEVLYSTIGEWCQITEDTVLLDICCGTGTIGLTLAKRVKKVVGIEMCKEAVEDAKHNARLNGVTNAEYYCQKAEDILPSLIWRYSREKVVAVVDPPRAGLHNSVIRAIRKCTFVERLIYASCKPTGAMTNLIDLTRSESKRVKGEPFKLLQAVTVDLFPHTPHSELLMLFERSRPQKSTENQSVTATQKCDQTLEELSSGIKMEAPIKTEQSGDS